jgi:poly-gamma-glutamate capsule biosynthesis protein CapA/YwtB (metallophosphatase superfamily)
LRSTVQALEQQGIDQVGAGENLEETQKILIRQVRDVWIGILAMAEHEFGIAGRNVTGTNPLDINDDR